VNENNTISSFENGISVGEEYSDTIELIEVTIDAWQTNPTTTTAEPASA